MSVQKRRKLNMIYLTCSIVALYCAISFLDCFIFPGVGSASNGEDINAVSSITKEGEEGEGDKNSEGDILEKSMAISSDFNYQREGRPDPFMPFITEQRIEAELAVETKKLTGMQLFEPGQLTLVGIIKTSRGPLAMAQDSVGKGYPLRKGMKIGRTGEIVEIVPNKVLIKEEAYKNARTKEIIYKTTEMVLKKEGVNE